LSLCSFDVDLFSFSAFGRNKVLLRLTGKAVYWIFASHYIRLA